MEAAQPFLQAGMVSIDVVEVKLRRLWIWFARHRQDVCRNSSPACESHNRRAAIAAELIGRRDDAAQRRGNRHTVQFRQYRVRRRSLTVARDDHRDLLGGQTAFGRSRDRKSTRLNSSHITISYAV